MVLLFQSEEIFGSADFIVECYMPIKRPLIPMHLFKSRDFCVLTIVSAVGGMLYYSLNGATLLFERTT